MLKKCKKEAKVISIAMTSYNGEKYIIQQLESLKLQTRKIDEIILVDDCSTDNTYQLVKEYIKINLPQCRLYKNEQNLGFIKTFKKSIALTNGDIIFLCDQDDVWNSNKIEEMSNIMENNDKVLSLCSSFTKIDSNGNNIISKNRPFSSNNGLIRKIMIKDKMYRISIKRVITYNISPGCTCAFKKELKDEFLNMASNIPHDLQINIIAANKSGLYFFNKSLINYRIHSANTIGLKRDTEIKKRIKKCESDVREKEILLNYLNKIGVNEVNTRYATKILKYHKERYKNLSNKRRVKGFFDIFKVFFKYGLVDTFIYDLLIIIKSKS